MISNRAGVSPSTTHDRSSEERLRRLEMAVAEHLGVFPGHTIYEGYHRWAYDDANSTVYYTIYADENRQIKKYEEKTRFNAADPSHRDYEQHTYYDESGEKAVVLNFTNYTYEGGLTDRITGFDVSISLNSGGLE